MASAGRVLPINKGTYNSATTYAPLDIVYYNEGTYCCKKTCTNVTPAEGEYWQKWVDVSGKVNKETGKGLSTNDFTDAEKAKTDNAVLWSERKGYVGKNLINPLSGGDVVSNITYVRNADGSITANGTANAESVFIIGYFKAEQGKQYTISSGVDDSSSTHRLWTEKKGTNSHASDAFPFGSRLSTDTAENKTRTAVVDEDCQVIIQIFSGQVVNNLTFYPMIRLSSISDDTYEPYLISNKELQDKSVFWEQAKGFVGKNLLPYPYQDGNKTQGSLTFTVNADHSITVNGTNDSGSTAWFTLANKNNMKPDNYIDQSVKFSGLDSDVKFGFYNGQTSKQPGNNEPIIFDIKNDNWNLSIGVFKNVTINNVTIYPMFRLASIADDTYEPYLPSNEELANDTTPIDITSSFFGTMPANVTLHQGKIFKIGKQIVGNITIKKSDNITSTKFNIPVTPQYLPRAIVSYGCFVGDEWSANAVGFMLLTTPNDTDKILQLADMANTGKQFAKLHFNYITA